jgi:hypothetical protein
MNVLCESELEGWKYKSRQLCLFRNRSSCNIHPLGKLENGASTNILPVLQCFQVPKPVVLEHPSALLFQGFLCSLSIMPF